AILLETSDVIPFPGDPTSEEYEAALCDCPCMFVYGLGSVSSCAITLPDGVPKAFSVMASDYVQDANMMSMVVCMFDSSCPHWGRTPVPNQNTMVQYSGHFSRAAAGGGIAVELKNITLNVGGLDNGTNSMAGVGAKK
ncbi:hypothetical protein BKA82DRAFT_56424, partial [Pisolithus tinctorius]